MNPDDLLYSSSHEWVRKGDPATIGITQFAQDQLGDVVFVELPEVGATLSVGQTFGTVESVKTVSDLYAPVSGAVVEINSRLIDQPELINSSPYEDGWLIKVRLEQAADLDRLLDRATYEATATH
jgi:glycine cleavage system H protein